MTIDNTGIAPTMSAELEDATALDPQATDAAPTHGVAWSSEDDIDTIVAYEPERRGWQTPVMVAFTALAAIAATGFLAWPHPQAGIVAAPPTAVAVVPAPPAVVPPPLTKDQRFAEIIRSEGMTVTDTDEVLGAGGRYVCREYQLGITQEDMVTIVMHQADVSRADALAYLDAAIEIYCPQINRY